MRTRPALGLVMVLALGARADEQPAALPPEKVAEVAKQRAILVVQFVEREPIAYSGIVGGTYWFTVQEVLRFEDEPATAQDGLWQMEHAELAGRKDLSRVNRLELTLEFPQGDAAQTKAEAALRERLVPGQRYVLAVPSTRPFSALVGRVVDDKWGSYGEAPALLEAVDDAALEAVKKALGGKERAAPTGPKAQPAPPPPGPAVPPGGGGQRR